MYEIGDPISPPEGSSDIMISLSTMGKVSVFLKEYPPVLIDTESRDNIDILRKKLFSIVLLSHTVSFRLYVNVVR